MPKRLRLKAVPKAPKRIGKQELSYTLEDSDSLQSMIDEVGNVDLSLVYYTTSPGYYGNDDVGILSWDRVETEKMFAERVKVYEEERAAYNYWYSENKDAIATELAIRKERASQRKAKSNVSRKKDLEDQLAMLEIEKVKLEKRKKDLES